MKGGHVILVIEDQDDEAEPFIQKLEAMGYACIRAASLEEVREALRKHRFCCVCLDLEIPSRRGLPPQPEGGLTAADEIRQVFCARDDQNRCHLLPIVGVSGHLDTAAYAREAYENGIDKSIVKPILRAKPSLKETLDWVFEKSGRKSHSACDRLNRDATGKAESASATTNAAMRRTMRLNGSRRGKLSTVQLDDKTLPFQKVSFHMVVGLLTGTLRSPDRWIHKHAIGCPTENNTWDGPKRLNQDLEKAGINPESFFENMRSGEYRLHPEIDVDWDHVDIEFLKEHSDGSVQELGEEMDELLGSR